MIILGREMMALICSWFLVPLLSNVLQHRWEAVNIRNEGARPPSRQPERRAEKNLIRRPWLAVTASQTMRRAIFPESHALFFAPIKRSGMDLVLGMQQMQA